MTNKEIKDQCESLYAVIKVAQEDLANIRKACPHTETFIGDYEWAPGHLSTARICSACGEFLPEKMLIKYNDIYRI